MEEHALNPTHNRQRDQDGRAASALPESSAAEGLPIPVDSVLAGCEYALTRQASTSDIAPNTMYAEDHRCAWRFKVKIHSNKNG